MAEAVRLQARGAAEGLLAPVGEERGVIASARDLQITAVVALDPTLFRLRMRESFAVNPPEGPRRAAGTDTTLLGVGPERWLALAEAHSPALSARLERGLAATAAVTDQSDAYMVLRLAGPKVRAALEKGVAVDLHPRAFPEDAVASTTCAHLNVIVWRLGEDFEIAASRSYSVDFCRWLTESAAEFGLQVAAPLAP